MGPWAGRWGRDLLPREGRGKPLSRPRGGGRETGDDTSAGSCSRSTPPSRVCIPGCRPAPQPRCTPNPAPSAPGHPGDTVLSPGAPCICPRDCHLFASFLSPPRSLPLFSRPGSRRMEKAELLSLRLLLDLPSLVFSGDGDGSPPPRTVWALGQMTRARSSHEGLAERRPSVGFPVSPSQLETIPSDGRTLPSSAPVSSLPLFASGPLPARLICHFNWEQHAAPTRLGMKGNLLGRVLGFPRGEWPPAWLQCGPLPAPSLHPPCLPIVCTR